jgi:hypothetical protein
MVRTLVLAYSAVEVIVVVLLSTTWEGSGYDMLG